MMFQHYRNLPDKCLPIRISSKAEVPLCLLGGKPPEGLAPRSKGQFFCSLALNHDYDVSIFLSWRESNMRDMFNSRSILYGEDSGLIECIVHKKCRQNTPASEYDSELPGLYLAIGNQINDVDPYGPNSPYSDHKIGGKPIYANLRDPSYSDAENALQAGYVLLLQMAFPGSEDSIIDATWPFGDLMFHLFALETGSEISFKYGWG